MLAALLIAAAAAKLPDPGFAVRMVKMSGDPASAKTQEHVRFCRDLGFNALWVESREAGVWSREAAPEGPRVTPEFVRFARWCRRKHLDVWVALRPWADSSGSFVFSDPDQERRLSEFASILADKAGVRHLVLALDDAPDILFELSDIQRYGQNAAHAHLDLTRRLSRALPAGVTLALAAGASTDEQLLLGLEDLPENIALVWNGPASLSPAITREDLLETRKRLGGRSIILEDNFPTDERWGFENAMALMLAPLSGREAGIRDVVAAYVACPALPLAGSRLSLMTTAQFLKDPGAYDPATALKAAMARLSGGNAAAANALDTQQLEWGGAPPGLNYWPPSRLNPALVARRLDDPAFVDSFTWTVDRYPGRMRDLGRLKDAPFREALLGMMHRRLGVARAVPLALDYLARVRNGDPESVAVLNRIDALRRDTAATDAAAGRVLEIFLTAASIPKGTSAP